MQGLGAFHILSVVASMKAPPKRKGNTGSSRSCAFLKVASMKAPPKRKGNHLTYHLRTPSLGLNESPSEKEGK